MCAGDKGNEDVAYGWPWVLWEGQSVASCPASSVDSKRYADYKNIYQISSNSSNKSRFKISRKQLISEWNVQQEADKVAAAPYAFCL
eukprot:COSAG02_NODE_9479_length_2204_cov_4.132870_2_plen_87_part_00